jgi:hypothetical protein
LGVFFLLSKLLYYVLMPAVWLVGLLLAALLARQPRRQRQWLQAAAVLALVGTNLALSNEALRAWELAPVRLGALPASADAAVLLTGIAQDRRPKDRVYLGPGADRLTHTLWLWRAGRVRRIIISGGSGSVLEPENTEARAGLFPGGWATPGCFSGRRAHLPAPAHARLLAGALGPRLGAVEFAYSRNAGLGRVQAARLVLNTAGMQASADALALPLGMFEWQMASPTASQ